jgi:hypothetical protein
VTVEGASCGVRFDGAHLTGRVVDLDDAGTVENNREAFRGVVRLNYLGGQMIGGGVEESHFRSDVNVVVSLVVHSDFCGDARPGPHFQQDQQVEETSGYDANLDAVTHSYYYGREGEKEVEFWKNGVFIVQIEWGWCVLLHLHNFGNIW